MAPTASVFLFLLAAPPLPEGNAYVRGLVQKQQAREEALNLYTYDVSEVVEELDGKGRRDRLEVTRYEVFHVTRRRGRTSASRRRSRRSCRGGRPWSARR
jgi:hypothetical protein